MSVTTILSDDVAGVVPPEPFEIDWAMVVTTVWPEATCLATGVKTRASRSLLKVLTPVAVSV